MKNYYPEKPEVKYLKTTVEMGLVVSHLQHAERSTEVKKTAYIIFRNESGNGKSGLNNNYGGFQADSGRWPEIYDPLISGVVTKTENKTAKVRLFLAFTSWRASLEMLLDRVESRGLYVGGHTHKVTNTLITTPTELAIQYKREWVTGNRDYNPTPEEKESFLSMYRQATKLFT